jgi:hypothetical protein
MLARPISGRSIFEVLKITPSMNLPDTHGLESTPKLGISPPTYTTELDWILVKDDVTKPRDKNALIYLHRIWPEPLLASRIARWSHSPNYRPITVDLPFHKHQALTAEKRKGVKMITYS